MLQIRFLWIPLRYSSVHSILDGDRSVVNRWFWIFSWCRTCYYSGNIQGGNICDFQCKERARSPTNRYYWNGHDGVSNDVLMSISSEIIYQWSQITSLVAVRDRLEPSLKVPNNPFRTCQQPLGLYKYVILFIRDQGSFVLFKFQSSFCNHNVRSGFIGSYISFFPLILHYKRNGLYNYYYFFTSDLSQTGGGIVASLHPFCGYQLILMHATRAVPAKIKAMF